MTYINRIEGLDVHMSRPLQNFTPGVSHELVGETPQPSSTVYASASAEFTPRQLVEGFLRCAAAIGLLAGSAWTAVNVAEGNINLSPKRIEHHNPEYRYQDPAIINYDQLSR
ncbi:MAG: hypothetical protein ACREGD_04125 [Candidatus Saccharimonadales bacterium]